MNPATLALENQYFSLRKSLPELEAQGATQDQLDALRTAIAQSRTNYWTAIGRQFHEDDPEVAALISQMNASQLALDQTVKHLGDVAKILNGITQAVDIGSKLAAKVIAL